MVLFGTCPAVALAQDLPLKASYTIQASVDRDLRTVQGEVTVHVVWTGNTPLNQVMVWLYPNQFRSAPSWITDYNREWIYPKGFSKGFIEIGSVFRDGKGVNLESITYRPIPRSDLPLDSHRLLAQIPLSPPLLPGQETDLKLGFRTQVPERTGRFGLHNGVLALAADWFPRVVSADGAGRWRFGDVLSPSDYAVKIKVPGEVHTVLNGEYHGPSHASRTQDLELKSSFGYPPSVVIYSKAEMTEAESPYPVRIIGTPGCRNPEGNEERVRQDVPLNDLSDLSCFDKRKRFLDIIPSGLDFLKRRGVDPKMLTPLTLVELQLRTHLADRLSGAIAFSNRLYEITNLDRVLKFHDMQVIKAIFLEAASREAAKRERPEDVFWVSEFMAGVWAYQYYQEKYGKEEHAQDILQWISFIPLVDQFLYTPQAPFKDAYFSTVNAQDTPRESPWTFNNLHPPGSLYYEKMVDFVGRSRTEGAVNRYLQGDSTFRAALEKEAKENLDWFFRQWDGPYPRMNYRIAGMASDPAGSGRYRHRVDVERQGQQVREPVDVKLVDEDGRETTVRWDGRGPQGRVTWESGAPLDDVVVDPDQRLVEVSSFVHDHPRADNATSHPMRSPVLQRIHLSLEAIEGIPEVELLFNLRRSEDLHHMLLLDALYNVRGGGGQIGYIYFWGTEKNPDRLRWFAGPLVTALRHTGTFGVTEEMEKDEKKGTSVEAGLVVGYDDRYYFFNPTDGLGVTLYGSSINTFLDSGGVMEGGQAGTRVFKLFPLAFRHILALYGQAEVSFGDLLPSEVSNLSNRQALRGFASDETVGMATGFIASEYRHMLYNDFGANLARFIWLEGLQGVLFAAAGTASDPQGYDHLFAKDRIFVEAGYGLRLHILWGGVLPGLIGVDLAVPIYPLDRTITEDGKSIKRQNFSVHLSMEQTF